MPFTLQLLGMPIALGESEEITDMKYGAAWLLGVPVSIIALWFVVNQMGCGF
jgi:hypothetical protein